MFGFSYEWDIKIIIKSTLKPRSLMQEIYLIFLLLEKFLE